MPPRTRTTTAATPVPATPEPPAPRTGFGVDIGGSGIKGAPVDLDTGELLADRFKVLTPTPSTPEAVAAAVAEVVAHFSWQGPVGVTFPAAIKNGVAMMAANVDQHWIGTDVAAVIEAKIPGAVTVINDADAAGLAEARFGAAKDVKGVVLLLTLGTGIGSALLVDGILVPNTEFGHIEVDGKEAEKRASAGVREQRGLSWERWAKRLQQVLTTYEGLLWPDLIVFGGGISRKADQWLPLLTARAPMVAARLQNEAGIVGAAMHVTEQHPATPAAKAPARQTAARKTAARKAPARTTAATAAPTPRPRKA